MDGNLFMPIIAFCKTSTYTYPFRVWHSEKLKKFWVGRLGRALSANGKCNEIVSSKILNLKSTLPTNFPPFPALGGYQHFRHLAQDITEQALADLSIFLLN